VLIKPILKGFADGFGSRFMAQPAPHPVFLASATTGSRYLEHGNDLNLTDMERAGRCSARHHQG
jgi:hypothetical protein